MWKRVKMSRTSAMYSVDYGHFEQNHAIAEMANGYIRIFPVCTMEGV